MGTDMEQARKRVVAEVLAEAPVPPTMVAARLLTDVLRDLPDDVPVEEVRLRTRAAKGIAQAELREFVAAGMTFTPDMEFARTLLTTYPPATLEAVAPLLDVLHHHLDAEQLLVLSGGLERAVRRRPDDALSPYFDAVLGVVQAFTRARVGFVLTPPANVSEDHR